MPMDPMKFAMWLVLVTLLSQSAQEAQCSRRGRRSLLELGLTLWCYRQRLRTPLFALNLYGCYCGTGGSGTPLDAVDQCCFLHDCCYRHARVSLECRGRVKWQPYEFACSQSGTECRSQSVCGRMACECDREFAECLTAAKYVVIILPDKVCSKKGQVQYLGFSSTKQHTTGSSPPPPVTCFLQFFCYTVH
uniref:Phospholipase A2 n=1 Tax=Chrysemys picta bellii TaxID=8478 RepID=A0A8C3P8I6_CHRPI